MCPDQTLQVINDFAGRLGRTPSYDEFTREYNGWYISQITTYFGSWTNALRMAGMVTVGEMRTQTRSPGMLVEYLKDFYPRHKRPPMRTECDLKKDLPQLPSPLSDGSPSRHLTCFLLE